MVARCRSLSSSTVSKYTNASLGSLPKFRGNAFRINLALVNLLILRLRSFFKSFPASSVRALVRAICHGGGRGRPVQADSREIGSSEWRRDKISVIPGHELGGCNENMSRCQLKASAMTSYSDPTPYYILLMQSMQFMGVKLVRTAFLYFSL
jgi:hypothetical protein